VNRGNRTQIATFQNRPVEHGYSGNLADVCPVGALLSHDFRFKMRVWFLEETESVCPGCSTGCNIAIDHRDGEPQRFRPRRNPEVNRSWICDEGRALYETVAVPERLQAPRLRRESGFERVDWAKALDAVAAKLVGARTAFVATPQASNEDLFAFARLAEAASGLLDFRVGDPESKLHERVDAVLLRADRNPNTRGALDLGLGRSGIDAIVEACRGGKIDTLVLQGPELLEAVPDLEVPFLVVIASHDRPALERAHAVLPAALWAECDGSFTNFQRRVQRFKAAVPVPGEARPRWEIAAELLRRLGAPLEAGTAREVFGLLARQVAGYEGLSHRDLGASGRALESGAEAALGAPA
jgi:NADH-quinone oxidoreductase subunit G